MRSRDGFSNQRRRSSASLTLPAGWNGRETFLVLRGVNSACYVWVNGQKVGYSEDSRLPAEFDVTKYVRPGENTVAVEVYRFSDGSYLEDQDFWRLSGLFRGVELVSRAPLHVRDFYSRTHLDAQYRDARQNRIERAHGEVQLRESKPHESLSVFYRELDCDRSACRPIAAATATLSE